MTQVMTTRTMTRQYDSGKFAPGDAYAGSHEYLRPLVQVELRRKFTSAECGYLVEVAKCVRGEGDRLLSYYVAVREGLIERARFWDIDAEKFLYKINSLTSFELLALVDAVFRFVERLGRSEHVFLSDLFDEPAPSPRFAGARRYDLDDFDRNSASRA